MKTSYLQPAVRAPPIPKKLLLRKAIEPFKVPTRAKEVPGPFLKPVPAAKPLKKRSPRNFYTSPPKHGHPNTTPNISMSPSFSYISEPYNSSKLPSASNDLPAFKTTSCGGHTFSEDKDVYGLPKQQPSIHASEKPQVRVNDSFTVFRPAGSTQGTFSPPPKYVSDEPRRYVKDPRFKTPFRGAGESPSRPTPSIELHTSNIKNEYGRLLHSPSSYF